jgi:hypothetical protein
MKVEVVTLKLESIIKNSMENITEMAVESEGCQFGVDMSAQVFELLNEDKRFENLLQFFKEGYVFMAAPHITEILEYFNVEKILFVLNITFGGETVAIIDGSQVNW